MSAFNSGREPVPGERFGRLDVTSRHLEEDDNADGPDTTAEDGWADPDAVEPWRETELPAPAWVVRPREPQQPPVWLAQGRSGTVEEADEATHSDDVYVSPVRESGLIEDDGMPTIAHPSLEDQPQQEVDTDEDTAVAELAVPPPVREVPAGILDAGVPGPRGDLATMSLDARELVAGLLDRWERTLEQRIYTEQRQRFQAELVARQNMVKQLQMELHTARAEHAAAQAEKDRVLAGKERAGRPRARPRGDAPDRRGGGADDRPNRVSPAALVLESRRLTSSPSAPAHPPALRGCATPAPPGAGSSRRPCWAPGSPSWTPPWSTSPCRPSRAICTPGSATCSGSPTRTCSPSVR